jgi:hypothetical protein
MGGLSTSMTVGALIIAATAATVGLVPVAA